MAATDVTPQQARRWLRHSHQRRIDLLKVRDLLVDIEDGTWRATVHSGTPIKVRDGVLLDGHHRMVAVLMFGQPVQMWVVHQ